MDTANNQIEADVAPAPERMVSVNEIGGPARSIAARLVATVLICGVAATGALMAIQRWRAHHAGVTPASAAPPRASATARRLFGSTAPAASAAATAGKDALSAPLVGSSCPDGLPGAVFNDQAGAPVLTPTGQPVRLCGNGQLLLPPLPVDSAARADNAARWPTPPGPSSPPAWTPPPAPPSAPSQAAPAASRYDGELFVPQAHAATVQGSANLVQAGYAEAPSQPAAPTPAPEEAPSPRSRLKTLLRAEATGTVKARLVGDRDLILPQGRSIDCNLSLRVVSDISGMAVCVLSSYVYGDSGVVALAEPGSVVTGDYIAIAAQGQHRLFITWSRLKTSKGVVIDLNSPAADALGTSGLDGYVDNRWPERIGAAMLLSVVQDTIAYETARASGGNGVAVFQQSAQAGDHLAERILDSTINIQPTVYKQQGDRASITVARDLDFGSVYVLRTK